jgi:hypothetical protein
LPCSSQKILNHQKITEKLALLFSIICKIGLFCKSKDTKFGRQMSIANGKFPAACKIFIDYEMIFLLKFVLIKFCNSARADEQRVGSCGVLIA